MVYAAKLAQPAAAFIYFSAHSAHPPPPPAHAGPASLSVVGGGCTAVATRNRCPDGHPAACMPIRAHLAGPAGLPARCTRLRRNRCPSDTLPPAGRLRSAMVGAPIGRGVGSGSPQEIGVLSDTSPERCTIRAHPPACRPSYVHGYEEIGVLRTPCRPLGGFALPWWARR